MDDDHLTSASAWLLHFFRTGARAQTFPPISFLILVPGLECPLVAKVVNVKTEAELMS